MKKTGKHKNGDDSRSMDSNLTSRGLRFSIASIMCTTGTFAVLLTYLKLYQPAEFLKGLGIVVAVGVAGVVPGIYFRRGFEVAYWSVLGAMTAFLCAVGQPLAHESFQYAWPLVGASTAVTAVLLDSLRLSARMLLGAAIGLTVLAVFSLMPTGAANPWTEVVCGPVAGAIMVGVVWVLETLRIWRSYSRSVLVFALAVGVIGGNVVGRWAGWL